MDQTAQIATMTACIPRLRRYARALLSDRSAADDLVQDTLERAWARLHQFRAGTDMRAWAFTIMHNVHVNQVRARRDAAPIDGAEQELSVRANQADGLEVRDLDRALRELPIDQREVLLLVALEDMSYEQVAQTLGIPIGTVMSRLSRARERLRALMGGTQTNSKMQVVK